MAMKKIIIFGLSLFTTQSLLAQAFGSQTITALNTVVNRYAPISQSITPGTSTLVINNANSFNFGLCPGDLIMVYQAQGAQIDTTQTGAYGNIINYNSAGFYEFKYVQATNGNTIITQTTFTNAYSSVGKTQVIKVPIYKRLTINNGASVIPKAWKDTTILTTLYRIGGLVVLSADSIVNNGTISANGAGFRGGVYQNAGQSFTVTSIKSTLAARGGEKGESIVGYQTDYDVLGGRYCLGAPANGGGGGNGHNAGGGGGANGFNLNPWSGQGVMIVNASNLLTAWALSPAYIANGNALTNSSGGGRGGYTAGLNNANPTTQGPGNAAWGSDNRREAGGLGGRALMNINAENRIYFGGGGGAGHADNNASASGGNGGGIVYLVTNTITGTGVISSNGNAGGSTIGCNCDGASGAGAGGSIVIKTGSLVPTQIIRANGGDGGNQLTPNPVPNGNPNESEGPGGGGGGGFIAMSSNAVVPQVLGGLNGTSLSNPLANRMTSNGATQGAIGQTTTVSLSFVQFLPIVSTFTAGSNSPVCAGATLSLTTNLPGPYSWLGPNSFTSNVQNPTISNVSPAASGVYFINLGGCFSGFSVSVFPVPSVTITNLTGSQSITCISPTVDLTVSTNYPGTLNFLWTSNTFTANTATITVVSANTLITLSAFDPQSGCATSATTSIRVNTVVPISAVAPINQSITCGPGVVATATGTALSPTINVTHSWLFPCNPLPSNSGGVTSVVNPGICSGPGGQSVNTSTYILTNNINGCSTTKTIQVVSTAGNYPTFGVTSAFNFTLGCSTRSVADINIVGANTSPPGGVVNYTLLPPSFTGTNYPVSANSTYTVNTPGTYTVIVRDNGNACETRIPLSILQNVFTPSIAAYVATNTLTCFTPSVILRGNSTTPNVSYTWRKTVAPTLVVDSLLTVNTTSAGASVPSATVIDNYTLTVLDIGNQCTSTTVVPIYQNTRPPRPGIALSFTALTCSIYSVNATNNSTTGILPGTFFGTGNLNAILWRGPSPQADLQNSSTYIGFTPGSYSMTVMDMNNGCTSATTALLGDNRIYPVIQTNSVVALDCGAGAAGVRLAANALNLTPSDVKAIWLAPTPPPNISNPNSMTLTTDGVGQYTLTVTTNTNNCSAQVYVNVVNGALNANFDAEPLSGFAPLAVNFVNNSASTSTTTGTSSITSVWSFGNGTAKTTTVNAATSALYTQPGTYTVTMYATKGTCIDTFFKVIKVDIPSKLEIPNVFTPNGDNANDIFFVKSANLTNITALIYDRWGTKIYELTTDKGNIAWDGKTQTGSEAPDGTYFYIITATGKDGQTYDTKGTVSLFR